MHCLALLFALVVLVSADYDPHRFKNFLLQNRMKQCETNPYVPRVTQPNYDSNQPRLPLSYYTPTGYFDSIPENQRYLFQFDLCSIFRIPPSGGAKEAERVPACNDQMIQPPALDKYTFETERWITTIGLNIYDGATWSMALALLGEPDIVCTFPQKFLTTL